MGRFDRRSSMKSRRRKAQRKKKEREKRQRETRHVERQKSKPATR